MKIGIVGQGHELTTAIVKALSRKPEIEIVNIDPKVTGEYLGETWENTAFTISEVKAYNPYNSGKIDCRKGHTYIDNKCKCGKQI